MRASYFTATQPSKVLIHTAIRLYSSSVTPFKRSVVRLKQYSSSCKMHGVDMAYEMPCYPSSFSNCRKADMPVGSQVRYNHSLYSSRPFVSSEFCIFACSGGKQHWNTAAYIGYHILDFQQFVLENRHHTVKACAGSGLVC